MIHAVVNAYCLTTLFQFYVPISRRFILNHFYKHLLLTYIPSVQIKHQQCVIHSTVNRNICYIYTKTSITTFSSQSNLYYLLYFAIQLPSNTITSAMPFYQLLATEYHLLITGNITKIHTFFKHISWLHPKSHIPQPITSASCHTAHWHCTNQWQKYKLNRDRIQTNQKVRFYL